MKTMKELRFILNDLYNRNIDIFSAEQKIKKLLNNNLSFVQVGEYVECTAIFAKTKTFKVGNKYMVIKRNEYDFRVINENGKSHKLDCYQKQCPPFFKRIN